MEPGPVIQLRPSWHHEETCESELSTESAPRVPFRHECSEISVTKESGVASQNVDKYPNFLHSLPEWSKHKPVEDPYLLCSELLWLFLWAVLPCRGYLWFRCIPAGYASFRNLYTVSATCFAIHKSSQPHLNCSLRTYSAIRTTSISSHPTSIFLETLSKSHTAQYFRP